MASPSRTRCPATCSRHRPELCWKYLGEIERATRDAKPNSGHLALARLAPRNARFTVLTPNLDGFHRAAGSQDLIEIHGNLHRLHCCFCPYELEVENYAGLQIPPSCPHCAGLVRPRVTLFGEALPEPELTRLYELLDGGVDLVLSIGTTSVFPYIAAPMLLAAQRGLPSVEINPGESEVSHLAQYRIRERAAPALERLMEMVQVGLGNFVVAAKAATPTRCPDRRGSGCGRRPSARAWCGQVGVLRSLPHPRFAAPCRERNPVLPLIWGSNYNWIPAFAGMTL